MLDFDSRAVVIVLFFSFVDWVRGRETTLSPAHTLSAVISRSAALICVLCVIELFCKPLKRLNTFIVHSEAR